MKKSRLFTINGKDLCHWHYPYSASPFQPLVVTILAFLFNVFIFLNNILKEKAFKIRLELLGEMIKGSLMDGPIHKKE